VERDGHTAEIASWREALEREGLLRPGAGEDGVVTALHRYVTWSPARLVSVSLADLVGERRTQNQPGTKDEYPNWRVPLGDGEGEPVYIEDFPKIARMEQIINALGGTPRNA
jgi:4-alpha-glucanotransferase